MRPGGAQRVRSKATVPGGLPVTDGGATTEASIQSAKRVLACRSLIQWTFCLTAVVLGFRVAHEVELVRDQFNRMEEASSKLFIQMSNKTNNTKFGLPNSVFEEESWRASVGGKSSRVYVGRHPILVRPWPHPNPLEMAQAYSMLARVQLEQQRLYGIQAWKPVIAITPMHVRTFQSVHLTGLVHTLSLVRGPVTWIVVEPEGVSAETAALLRQARVHKLVHLGAAAAEKRVPRSLQEREILESHLRIEGLRYVREQRMEGVVVFADDSNVYSMQFFDMAQKVEWVGALPVGILGHAGFEDSTPLSSKITKLSPLLQVQAPLCDASGSIKGWHAYGSSPLYGDGDAGVGRARALDGDGDVGVERARTLEGDEDIVVGRARTETTTTTLLKWAGFVVNARAVWEDDDDGDPPGRPEWIKEWTEWAEVRGEDGERVVDVRAMVCDEARVEALGACGGRDGDDDDDEAGVLLWWARVEARSDSRFPPRWELETPLEMVVPARRTPWPDRVFPPPSPPPPASHSTKSKGGNRSGGRPRRGKRRADHTSKTSQLEKLEKPKGV